MPTYYELTRVDQCPGCNGVGETREIMPGFVMRCHICKGEGIVKKPVDAYSALVAMGVQFKEEEK